MKKRMNPDTGLFFKKFDKRPSSDPQDGKVFYKYKKPSGFQEYGSLQSEIWIPDMTDEERRRINPKTGEKYTRGDDVGNGKLFFHYQKLI